LPLSEFSHDLGTPVPLAAEARVNVAENNVIASEGNMNASESSVNGSESNVNASEATVIASEGSVNGSESSANASEGSVIGSESNVIASETSVNGVLGEAVSVFASVFEVFFRQIRRKPAPGERERPGFACASHWNMQGRALPEVIRHWPGHP
jgi:hypothetical protein